jgi:hypothetical protein
VRGKHLGGEIARQLGGTVAEAQQEHPGEQRDHGGTGGDRGPGDGGAVEEEQSGLAAVTGDQVTRTERADGGTEHTERTG